MRNFRKNLKKYASGMNPTQEQRDSMFVKVFNQNPDQLESFSVSGWFVNPAVLGMGIIAGFFILPVAFSSAVNFRTYEPWRATDEISYSPTDSLNDFAPNEYYGEDVLQRKLAQVESELGNIQADSDLKYNKSINYYLTNEDATTPQQDRLVNREGTLVLESYRPVEVMNSITGLISREGGYIVSSSVSQNLDHEIVTLRLQVPVNKFDQFLTEIVNMNVNIISQNIQLTDMQNRYAALQESVTSVDTKISDKTTELKNAKTKLEKEKIQAEIEQLKSNKLAYERSIQDLKDDVALSSLTVTVQGVEGFEILGSRWASVGDLLGFMAQFWSQVMILISPVIIVGLVMYRKKVAKVFRDKFRVG